jgi:hypothetical protein
VFINVSLIAYDCINEVLVTLAFQIFFRKDLLSVQIYTQISFFEPTLDGCRSSVF